MTDLEIEFVALDSLSLDPRNARTHDKRNIDGIKTSLARFGQRKPIVVTSQYMVVAGNGTLEAARALEWDKIAVTVFPSDDPDEVRAFAIADNRTAELADWDEEILSEHLRELSATEAGLAGTGFTNDDLAKLIGAGSDDDPADEDVPDLPAEPTAVEGDVWLLGEHRLVVGDATEPETISKVMDGAMADMIFTDPPYNVGYDPESRTCHFSPERKANPFGEIQADEMSDEDYLAFLRASFDAASSRLRQGGVAYVCHAHTHSLAVHAAFREYFYLSSCLVWVKSVHAFGRQDYHWKHEPIMYGWREGAAHTWYGDRTQSTVWEFPADHYTGEKYQHPTQKPIPLVKRAIANSSPASGIVLDPFGGSGSTMIAAERLGRRARLVELDPRYADVICRRFQTVTGTKPVNEATGEAVDFSED